MMWIIKDEYYGNQFITKESGSAEIKVTPDVNKAIKFFSRQDAVDWITEKCGYLSVFFKFKQI